ncbi:MAG: hypothetical protein ACLPZY_07525 [Terracidiphilus sp.]
MGRWSISVASVAVLVVQLALVSTVAGKYLWQRWRCPRVWTRTVAIDPELPMRGRYLSQQLMVDGCQSTLPSAKAAQFPRDVNGAAVPGPYGLRPLGVVEFNSELKVANNKLVAVQIQDPRKADNGQLVDAWPGTQCDQMRLEKPVAIFIADSARSPLPLKPGQELWVEITVPPKGPPRPLQMALKDDGAWKPLAF